MLLYHTSYGIIDRPDIHFGRKNADFGQGFYLSESDKFAGKWVREKKDAKAYVNTYELDTEGLNILRLKLDENWFDYIFSNRAGKSDKYPEADVITGPIANDSIYDTFGIFTSGFLDNMTALKLLSLGPKYTQIAIKSEKAAGKLKFISAREIDNKDIAGFRTVIDREEEEYQKLVADTLDKL